MPILVEHLAKTEEPRWQILTWKRRWWKRREYNIRLVFGFYVDGDEERYRLDLDDMSNELIFTHPRPKALLEEHGIDVQDDGAWRNELEDLKDFLLEKYSKRIIELGRNKPRDLKHL